MNMGERGGGGVETKERGERGNCIWDVIYERRIKIKIKGG